MEQQYLDLLRLIRDEGTNKTDRTGTGTRSIFGHQMRHDLSKGFPLLTTKKLHLKSIIYELLWFLKGDTNIKYLNDNGVKIWDEWADKDGNLGPVYGKQWRSWECPNGETIDQITDVMQQLKKSPDSRRMIISAWNVADLKRMALMPCHLLFQFNTRPLTETQRKVHRIEGTETKYFLDCQLYQRSADVFLGVPFNIASYALFTMMIAQISGCIPGDFIHTFGDVHIYNNHFEQVEEQLSRTLYEFPKMHINSNVKDIFSFTYEDFVLEGYQSHPAIKAKVSV